MQQLDAVNDMLATIGVKPLNSLDDLHPFKARAIRTLTRRNRILQAQGWWFNEEWETLQPDAQTTEMYVPNDAIALRFVDPRFVERGRRVFDIQEQTYSIKGEQRLYFIRLVPFDDLPEVAAAAVSAAAVVDFQRSYDADNARTQQAAADLQNTIFQLNAEDTRQRRYNVLDSSPRLQEFLVNARAARYRGGQRGIARGF